MRNSADTMTFDVDVHLRIPKVKEPALDADGHAINNEDVRFIRRVSLRALPNPGDVVQLDTSAGLLVACEVLRADWSDRDNRFIVYCSYAKRSIRAEEYHALVSDPDWVRRHLL